MSAPFPTEGQDPWDDTLRAYLADPGNMPAGATLTVYFGEGGWPDRPTDRTDITVHWFGGTVLDTPTSALPGVDYWDRPSDGD